MITLPFFEIGSKPLQEMLGCRDKRTILNRLNELGVEIRSRGKNQYVLTEDILNSLKENVNEIYRAEDPRNQF